MLALLSTQNLCLGHLLKEKRKTSCFSIPNVPHNQQRLYIGNAIERVSFNSDCRLAASRRVARLLYFSALASKSTSPFSPINPINTMQAKIERGHDTLHWVLPGNVKGLFFQCKGSRGITF